MRRGPIFGPVHNIKGYKISYDAAIVKLASTFIAVGRVHVGIDFGNHMCYLLRS